MSDPENFEEAVARKGVTPRVHIGCGGAVLWDLSGGYCTKCHAENLEPDDAERGTA
jgi:hypothetical protein